MKKLFLIHQSQNTGWDTYDSAVVVAEDGESAREILPCSYYESWSDASRAWASGPDYVTAEFLADYEGEAELGDVIINSFNAG